MNTIEKIQDEMYDKYDLEITKSQIALSVILFVLFIVFIFVYANRVTIDIDPVLEGADEALPVVVE